MNSSPGIDLPHRASFPVSSVDWRFYLPVSEATRVLVIENGPSDFQRSFRDLKIPITSWSIEKPDWVADLSSQPFIADGFDVVAAPLGVDRGSRPVGRSEYVQIHRAVRRLVRPGGALLVGFSNRWDARSIGDRTSYSSTLHNMTTILGEVGYTAIRFYGAMRVPVTPEYIFPLSAQALGFVLRHRYQHKLPNAFLNLPGFAVNLILNFLPHYFALATMDVRT